MSWTHLDRNDFGHTRKNIAHREKNGKLLTVTEMIAELVQYAEIQNAGLSPGVRV